MWGSPGVAVVGLAAPWAPGVAPPCVAVSVPREGNTLKAAGEQGTLSPERDW